MDIAYHKEERWNAITHGIGILLAVAGLVVMWNQRDKGSELASFSILVYSISLIILFISSTLYHSVSIKKYKTKLRVLDHISIYYLIAGTYTPVALITLIEGNGWQIFYAIWGLAFFGTILKIFFTGRFEVFSLLLYLIMGWLIVFDIVNLIELSSNRALFFLFLGGAFYTGGIFFYVQRKIPYNHLIWHLFVMGGAFSHWLLIFLEVIPG